MKSTTHTRANHGGILLTTLIFAVVIATMLGGLGTLVVSFYSRAKTESTYASAINLADAGANYELRKINQNVSTADLPTGNPPGTTVSFGPGTFRVYCTMINGTTAWDEQTVPFYIFSTSGVGSASRQVKMQATGSGAAGTYAVFGVQQGIMDAAPTIVNGDVGTNGFFTFNNNPSVTGNVIFNGSGSNWQSPPHATYNVVYKPNAVVWPTVENIAISTFGSTGLSYVASNNDNALASPPITNPDLLINSGTQTFVGKSGGANYYLTNLTCNGSSNIAFNNTAGPITIWFGPSGASTTINLVGGTATIKSATDSTKPVRIYIATSNDVDLNGSAEFDAGLYNVNNAGSGRIIFNGSPTMYTSVISNMFTFNQAPIIHYQTGYFYPLGTSVYSFNNSWIELNCL
jgi:hypothetical protein